MSYYIIDLVFHILLGALCASISIYGFCIEAYACAILQLLVAIGCIFLVVFDIKEIKTELWWNKQVMNKKYFSDDEDDDE